MSPRRARPPLWLTALFALAFACAGVLAAVFAFAPNESVYRSLVVPGEPREILIRLPDGGTWSFSREMLVILHRKTVAYVLGGSSSLPTAPGGAAIYTAAESSHFADVRRLFGAVRVAAIVACLVVVAVAVWARRRGHLARLVRNGAIGAAALVVVIAAVFAVAFEPAFLAFHYIFFPEGNFLFDPATSNMLLVYPEPYWYGITLRIGISFIALAAIVAGVAAFLDRQGSAIVPTT